MILDLLAEHGITPKLVSSAKGGEYHSPCPRCNGTDRFHVWPEQYDGQGSFWCRSCDLGGDCIKFLMEYSGLTFKESAQRTGKQLEQQRPSHKPTMPKDKDQQPTVEPRQCNAPVNAWQQQAQKMVKHCTAALQDNHEQLQYLASRGINAQQAQKWQLGFVADPRSATKNCVYSSRSKWGLEPKPQNKKPDALWIPRGIVIPNIIDTNVDSLRIRRSKTDRQQAMPDLSYHVMPGSGSAPLLGYTNQRVIIVVEAQLDAILIDQYAGDLVGVLALGNNSARPDGRAHQALNATSLILVALDNDTAGQQSTAKWLHWYDNATTCQVPSGKDPGEAYEAGVNLRQWIINNIPAVWSAPKVKKAAHCRDVAPCTDVACNVSTPAWLIKLKSGQTLCIVADVKNKNLYQKKTGFTTLTETDLDQLKKMGKPERDITLAAMGIFTTPPTAAECSAIAHCTDVACNVSTVTPQITPKQQELTI